MMSNHTLIQNFKKVLLFSGLFLFLISCETSSPDNFFDDDGSALPGTLTLSVNSEIAYNNTVVEFTVVDENNTDVSALSDISVNGEVIMGNTRLMDQVGNYTVTASYNGATSNTVAFEIIDPTYTAKVLIEDYTGAWCGWCPRISQGIDDLANNPNVVSVAIHNNDPMAFRLESQMASMFNVNNYPTGILNRDVRWGRTSAHSMDLNEPLALLNRAVASGLAIESTINGNTVNIDVRVGFEQAHSGAKLVVLALENGIIGPQENYTNNYGGPRNIPDFEHNHILRDNISDLFGDDIPAESQAARSIYSASYTYNAAGVADIPAMEIVAILVDGVGRVINVQKALAGTDKDFD